MQKNNKNKVLGGIKELRLFSFILLTFLMLAVFDPIVSYAQDVYLEEDLTARIHLVEAQLESLTEESALAEAAINSYGIQLENLQAQITDANAKIVGLQNQSENLLTIISAVESEIITLNSRQDSLITDVDMLRLTVTQLTQQRIDVVHSSNVKQTELLENLSLVQADYIKLQELGEELIAQFDIRLVTLNQYLAQASYRRLSSYLQRYINLLVVIRDRYARSIENSKSVYVEKIAQIQEEIEQLDTETALLLAAIDLEMASDNADISAIQNQVGDLQNQVLILNGEKSASQSEQISIANSIVSWKEQLMKLSVDLEVILSSKAQLVSDNEIRFAQMQPLLSELSQLLALREESLASETETREEKIANALAALKRREMSNAGRCQANTSNMFAVACFEADKQEVVRITYLQLLALGIDLAGVPKNNIGVLSNGQSVPLYVAADDLFNESSFIELVTEGNDSIYSDSMSYLIYVDFTEEFSLSAISSELPNDLEVVGQGSRFVVASTSDVELISSSYTETLHYEKDDFYSISGLSDFGWTDTNGFHYIYSGQTKTVDIAFELDAESQLDDYADLVIEYAKSAFVNDRVKTIVYLNGLPLGEEYIDQPGLADTRLELEVPPGVLKFGENNLSLSATNIGVGRMSFQFDEFTLSYQRRLTAKEGALTFIAGNGQYRVSNFAGDDAQHVVAFKQTDADQIERIAPFSSVVISAGAYGGVATTGNESLGNSFVLEATSDTRFTIDTVNANIDLILPREYQDIISPIAEYLIISHADFIGTQAMADLINLRQTEYSVQVVDVDQIYAQYSQGVFDAQAIKQFIGDKINNSSTKMVLLVGDDTYDYKNRLDTGEQSFIPSMYLTYPKVMAADSIYVDHNDDQLPDIAIGRLPVETVKEFSNVVEKTVLFSQNMYSKKAVLATNYSDGYGESHYHPALKKIFYSDWSITDALMLEDSVEARDAAKSIFLDSIGYRGGSGLMVYTGHNSYATGPMFTSHDIPLLVNHGIPTTAVMIDSFTGFYISDQFTGAIGVQAEDLLIADGVGAAAVFAPSSTVGLQAVQTRLIWRISRNYTYGEAYLNAMQVSYRSGGASYNLLGDPGLRLNTF